MELKNGSDDSTLDDKGRVSIPVRFREQFLGELVMALGIEKCIYIMKPAEWENFAKNLRNPEMFTQAERRYFENKHLIQAEKVTLDKVGRIAIRPLFRRYANLTKDCMVSCFDGRIRIWDIPTYEAYIAEFDPSSLVAIDKYGSQDIFKAS
jgi:MraZ protein